MRRNRSELGLRVHSPLGPCGLHAAFLRFADGVPRGASEVVEHHNALSDSLACAGIVLDLARRSGARSMAELTAHYGVRLQRATL